jgi:hypothetical protein
MGNPGEGSGGGFQVALFRRGTTVIITPHPAQGRWRWSFTEERDGR